MKKTAKICAHLLYIYTTQKATNMYNNINLKKKNRKKKEKKKKFAVQELLIKEIIFIVSLPTFTSIVFQNHKIQQCLQEQ